MKKVIHTANAPAAIGPYSQAIMANNTLFVSGQIAINPSTGELEINERVKETHRVMKNIEAILSEANLNWSHVVKASIFLKTMDDYALVNAVYGEYFKENPPAREAVQVVKLPKDVNVEISVIAVK
ncbi:MAG: RidA family protein [Flavobacteriales bacterium]